MKKIEEARVGDLVLTKGGTYERIIDVGSRLHRSNTTGGLTTRIHYKRFNYPLECTHDHKVLVLRGNNVDWIEANSVKPRDMLLSPILSGKRTSPIFINFPERLSFAKEQTLNGSSPFVNGRYNPLPREILIDDDFLFTVGWFLAEGFSLTSEGKGKFVSFSGHRLEITELERIKIYFESFGLTATIGPVRKNALELRVYSSELACWFKELFGEDAYSKRIPHEWIEGWDVDSLVKILDAYRHGDGHCRNKQNEWVTVSHLLALQTLKISELNGYQPTMRQVQNGKNKGSWICCFTKSGNPCSPLLRKRVDGFVCLPVVSVETCIESSKDKMVYDLTVENDESFVVGRAIVHNCHRIGQKSVVSVINFVCKDTIEERIRLVLYAKNVVSSEALGDDVSDAVLRRITPKQQAALL
jgi:intein/homing endonuclease